MGFHIGQRVTTAACKSGTIVHIFYDTSFGETPREYCGVAFDEYVSGHSCDGRCEYGYGWYMPSIDLIPIDSCKSIGLEELI